MCARSVVIDGLEDQAEFDSLLADLWAKYNPVDVVDKHFVEQVAIGFYKSRRLPWLETAASELALAIEVDDSSAVEKQKAFRGVEDVLLRFGRYSASMKKSLAHDLSELEKRTSEMKREDGSKKKPEDPKRLPKSTEKWLIDAIHMKSLSSPIPSFAVEGAAPEASARSTRTGESPLPVPTPAAGNDALKPPSFNRTHPSAVESSISTDSEDPHPGAITSEAGTPPSGGQNFPGEGASTTPFALPANADGPLSQTASESVGVTSPKFHPMGNPVAPMAADPG